MIPLILCVFDQILQTLTKFCLHWRNIESFQTISKYDLLTSRRQKNWTIISVFMWSCIKIKYSNQYVQFFGLQLVNSPFFEVVLQLKVLEKVLSCRETLVKLLMYLLCRENDGKNFKSWSTKRKIESINSSQIIAWFSNKTYH